MCALLTVILEMREAQAVSLMLHTMSTLSTVAAGENGDPAGQAAAATSKAMASKAVTQVSQSVAKIDATKVSNAPPNGLRYACLHRCVC